MTKPRKPIAERIRTGLEEALAHAKGELTLQTIEQTTKNKGGRDDRLDR